MNDMYSIRHPKLDDLIKIFHEHKLEYHVAFTDEHVVSVNFWCEEVKKSVDNQGISK